MRPSEKLRRAEADGVVAFDPLQRDLLPIRTRSVDSAVEFEEILCAGDDPGSVGAAAHLLAIVDGPITSWAW